MKKMIWKLKQKFQTEVFPNKIFSIHVKIFFYKIQIEILENDIFELKIFI